MLVENKREKEKHEGKVGRAVPIRERGKEEKVFGFFGSWSTR